MPYWRLFYHLVWATHDRQSWLTTEVEPVVHGYIRSKAVGLGATVFALDGTQDHVHVVVAMPPSISVARFAGQLKGASSTRLNKAGLERCRDPAATKPPDKSSSP
ncbi:MAG: IS200/IS605 family transposase [Thermoanaerobaculia bacterium]